MNTVQQSSINPTFAAHAAQQLREATDDLHRVFDNLREIARGDDPKANGYDRLRATRVLYDRGFGKVTKNTPHTPVPGSSQPSKSEESHNHTNHSSDIPAPKPAASNRPVARLEQKLDDALGSPQAPASPRGGGEPALSEASVESNGAVQELSPIAPGFVPDLVRDSQYYVLEITNYGEELKSILMDIHEPDPDDDSIRSCHRIAAAQMIIDRVLGPASSLQQALDHPYDPAEDPYWALRHPADVDSGATIEELVESDRKNREFIRAMHKEDDGSCDDCTDEYLCEYHDPDGEFHEYTNITEDDIDMLARAMRNLAFNRDRLYMDRADGRLKLRPRNYIDDS